MAMLTLTEVNQNVSAALRLADHEDVLISRLGKPVYRISRIPQDDPISALVAAGKLTPPTGGWKHADPLPTDLASGTTTEILLSESRGRF
jgi:antitoxin (DNA-binding transcriptional repressor) of toxin-antitoxin stability system